MFIVLDGPDGAGKTTLAKGLAGLLAQAEIPTLSTCEPHLSRTREWLSDKRVSARELAIAFAHDRDVHLHDVVAPALAAGQVVICDRYILSTIVYQSLHNDPAFVEMLVANVLEPDLTILVDAPTEVCMERLKATGKAPDRYESRMDLQRRVREGYLAEAQRRGYPVLDGSLTADEVLYNAVMLLHTKTSTTASLSLPARVIPC